MITGPILVSGALFFLSHISVNGNYWTDVLPGFVLMAMGMGMTFIATTMAATAGVPHHEAGLASGLLNTSQQVGGALGLAILSGIASAGTKAYLEATASVALVDNLAATHTAQVNGFHDALLVAAAFPLITTVVAATFIRNYKVIDTAPSAHM